MDSSLTLKSHDNIYLLRLILWRNRGADQQILASLLPDPIADRPIPPLHAGRIIVASRCPCRLAFAAPINRLRGPQEYPAHSALHRIVAEPHQPAWVAYGASYFGLSRSTKQLSLTVGQCRPNALFSIFGLTRICPVHLFLALQAIFQAAIDRYPGMVRRKVR